ncbi:MAG: hypothetical protein Q8O30_08370, partial [Candidatus Omnitrophota bacterium]|nr:hypothetical protein [Candidatus Omnitrophota bacterium]
YTVRPGHREIIAERMKLSIVFNIQGLTPYPPLYTVRPGHREIIAERMKLSIVFNIQGLTPYPLLLGYKRLARLAYLS